jgi:hypothetical protein
VAKGKKLNPSEQADRLEELLDGDQSETTVMALMQEHPELSEGWTVLAKRRAEAVSDAAATRPARGGGAPPMDIQAMTLP